MPLLTQTIRDQIGGLGESSLIRRILQDFGSACPPTPEGPGDDAAILAPTRRTRLITADPVIYNQHFTAGDPPRKVAAKLLRRNLSDIAAMGGRPEAALLSMALSAETSRRWIRDFILALGREARRFKVSIVGGDCSQTSGPPGFFLTLLGLSTSRRVLTRTGARSGDAIYVTGSLGGSLLGRQFSFEPRLPEGQWLARRSAVHSMIDLSDGLAKDVVELIPAGQAAVLDARSVPIAPAARKRARVTGRHALEHSFIDGEDFELLFTVSGNTNQIRFEAAWKRNFTTRLTRIGALSISNSDHRKLRVHHAPSGFDPGQGYEHFR